jgi:hypothetical protein
MGNFAATAYKYLFSWRAINGKGRPNMPLYFAIRAEFYLCNALCRYTNSKLDGHVLDILAWKLERKMPNDITYFESLQPEIGTLTTVYKIINSLAVIYAAI